MKNKKAKKSIPLARLFDVDLDIKALGHVEYPEMPWPSGGKAKPCLSLSPTEIRTNIHKCGNIAYSDV